MGSCIDEPLQLNYHGQQERERIKKKNKKREMRGE